MPVDWDPSLPPIGLLVDEMTTLVSRAAAAIVAIDRSTVMRWTKQDLSPVTAADAAAQSIIVNGLTQIVPGLPIVSEEAGELNPIMQPGATFVLVDPLDGTQEFLAGRDEFTVNIAVVSRGTPVAGCIAAPALALIWSGAVGYGAERFELLRPTEVHSCGNRRPIRTRPLPDRDIHVAVSRSHFDSRTERFLARLPSAHRIACGSSLKFCRIAEGSVDVYPRLGPTHEWDIAAAHAIVVAAGGIVAAPDGRPLIYGRGADGYAVPGFVAWGDPVAAEGFWSNRHWIEPTR